MLALFLAIKEIWHSRGRFLLIALIVTLITTLVLFIAALAEGLGAGNREYLQKLNGELVVYQANVELSIGASRLGRDKLAQVRRVEGVEAVGQVAYSSATVVLPGGAEPVDVSLFGVEPGMPGEPPALQGRQLSRDRAKEVVIGQRLVELTGLGVGDTLVLKSIQGTEEEFYNLEIVGVSDRRGYFIQPSIFVPYLTWDQVRPQGSSGETNDGDFVSNLIVVKLRDSAQLEMMAERIEQQVDKVEVVDRKTAYEATPGYSAQQSTLDTQRYFTFFIGILVLGGFFQIQTLQKVAQIGMLKAIGTPTVTIAVAAIAQIVLINAFGVLLGALGSYLLSLTFPPTLPIIFRGDSTVSAVVALMLIGPAGGLVSVVALLRVEPLTALGLAQ